MIASATAASTWVIGTIAVAGTMWRMLKLRTISLALAKRLAS